MSAAINEAYPGPEGHEPHLTVQEVLEGQYGTSREYVDAYADVFGVYEDTDGTSDIDAANGPAMIPLEELNVVAGNLDYLDVTIEPLGGPNFQPHYFDKETGEEVDAHAVVSLMNAVERAKEHYGIPADVEDLDIAVEDKLAANRSAGNTQAADNTAIDNGAEVIDLNSGDSGRPYHRRSGRAGSRRNGQAADAGQVTAGAADKITVSIDERGDIAMSVRDWVRMAAVNYGQPADSHTPRVRIPENVMNEAQRNLGSLEQRIHTNADHSVSVTLHDPKTGEQVDGAVAKSLVDAYFEDKEYYANLEAATPQADTTSEPAATESIAPETTANASGAADDGSAENANVLPFTKDNRRTPRGANRAGRNRSTDIVADGGDTADENVDAGADAADSAVDTSDTTNGSVASPDVDPGTDNGAAANTAADDTDSALDADPGADPDTAVIPAVHLDMADTAPAPPALRPSPTPRNPNPVVTSLPLLTQGPIIGGTTAADGSAAAASQPASTEVLPAVPATEGPTVDWMPYTPDVRTRLQASGSRSREEGRIWARQLMADFERFADSWHGANMARITERENQEQTVVQTPEQPAATANAEPATEPLTPPAPRSEGPRKQFRPPVVEYYLKGYPGHREDEIDDTDRISLRHKFVRAIGTGLLVLALQDTGRRTPSRTVRPAESDGPASDSRRIKEA